MAISYPAPLEDESSPSPPSATLPDFIKPWRTVSGGAGRAAAPNRTRSLWNPRADAGEFNRAFAVGLALILLIVGILLGKVVFAYVALALFALAIVGTALTDVWGGMLLYIAYLSMEGMFKYTTSFNTVTYSVGPILGVALLGAWRIISLHTQRHDTVPNAMPPLSALVIAIGCTFVIGIANPEAADPLSAMASTVLWYISPLSFFFIAYFVASRTPRVTSLLYFAVAIGTVVSMYAMFQYQMGESWCYSHIAGLKSIFRVGWFTIQNGVVTKGVFRPVSTASAAGGYVGWSVWGILASLCMIVTPTQVTGRRIFGTLLIAVMGVALVITGIRVTVFVLLLTMPVVLFLQIRTLSDTIRVYLAGIGIAALLLGSFTVANLLSKGKLTARFATSFSDPLSAYQKNRGNHVSNLVQQVLLRPLGRGPQRLAASYAQGQYANTSIGRDESVLLDSETEWNSLQLQYGVFCLMLMAAFSGIVVVRGWLICRSIEDSHLKSSAVFAYAVVISTTLTNFGGPALQENVLFWAACGVLFAMPRQQARLRLAGAEAAAARLAGAPE